MSKRTTKSRPEKTKWLIRYKHSKTGKEYEDVMEERDVYPFTRWISDSKFEIIEITIE